jgi:cbb3-type cytochrome oxidase subunit 1
MAVYGPGCHPQNIIWTSASFRSMYYFVGDRQTRLIYSYMDRLANKYKYGKYKRKV